MLHAYNTKGMGMFDMYDRLALIGGEEFSEKSMPRL